MRTDKEFEELVRWAMCHEPAHTEQWLLLEILARLKELSERISRLETGL